MLEKDLEQKARKRIEKEGGIYYKFVSPGRTGVPDRLHLKKVPKKHYKIVSNYVRFVEHKKPGGSLSTRQKKEIEALENLGYKVDVEYT